MTAAPVKPAVDFRSQVAALPDYACRLIRKAYASGTQMLVLLPDPHSMAEFDTLLWSFSQEDFLPHVCLPHPLAGETPIVLACTIDETTPAYPLLINLGAPFQDAFLGFARIIELVGQAAEEIEQGRLRYRQYQQHSLPLTHSVAHST